MNVKFTLTKAISSYALYHLKSITDASKFPADIRPMVLAYIYDGKKVESVAEKLAILRKAGNHEAADRCKFEGGASGVDGAHAGWD